MSSLDELRTELRALRGDFTKPISKMKKADVAAQIAVLRGMHTKPVEDKPAEMKPVKDKPAKMPKTVVIPSSDHTAESPNIARKRKVKVEQ